MSTSYSTQALFAFSVGHFMVDSPSQNYQVSSISGKLTHNSWSAKMSLPYIQRASTDSTSGQSGLGNGMLKISRKWNWSHKALVIHGKQKLATADSNTVAKVNDRSLSVEGHQVLGRGIGILEVGYWWRQNKDYKRDNTWYGVLGYLKPVKPYAVGVLIDHKPTALGEEDSVASLLFKFPIKKRVNTTILIGTGLNKTSSNVMIGAQLTQKY